MIDRKLGGDSVTLIRIRKKDGSFLFTAEECLRYIEVLLARKEKAGCVEPPLVEEKEIEKPGNTGQAAWWKPTGRGKTSWIDSE
jgi:hypothetical protein